MEGQEQLEKDLRELGRRRLVTMVSDHRYFLPHQLQQLAGIAQELAKTEPFTARAFRDATGMGRNVAIDVLEYFDSRGFTRRQGDVRIVLREQL